MIVHFARTLYHRTGLAVALGWARAWILGEVASVDVEICDEPILACVVPAPATLACAIPDDQTLNMRC